MRRSIRDSTMKLDPGAAGPMFSEESRRLLDELNKHARIGPYAHQDGDLITWWICAVSVALIDCLLSIRTDAFSGQESATAQEIAEWLALTKSKPQGGSFLESLQLSGRRFFLRAHATPTAAELSAWDGFYSLVETELSTHWGGRNIRIRKRARPLQDPIEIIKAGLKAGQPIAQLFRIAGVCRATGYRILRMDD